MGLMKTKPLPSHFIALGLLLVPVVIAIRLILIGQTQPITYSLDRLWPLLGLAMVATVIAYGVWKVRTWGFYGLLLLGMTAVAADLYNWGFGKLNFSIWTLLDLATVIVAVALIVQKRVRQPYLDPSIRWWERAARHSVDIAGSFYVDNKKTDMLILDLSASGCFANCSFDYEPGTVVKLEINFKELHFVSNAVFIRRSQSPAGIGWKFVDTSREDEKTMRRLLSAITAKAA